MAMKRNMMATGLVAIVLLPVSLVGCQQHARIEWDPLEPCNVAQKTPVVVGDLAEIRREEIPLLGVPQGEEIGKHTFTVFAIPVGSINADQSTPLKATFEKAVRESLEAAGFEIVPPDKAPAGSARLRGELRECWWWSYTWFWPLVIQGGRNRVALCVEDSSGNQLWEHEFSRAEPGMALGGSYALDLMVKWSMTKLTKDIVEECSGEAFRAAIQNRRVAAGAQGAPR
jgi:hypothetical protein